MEKRGPGYEGTDGANDEERSGDGGELDQRGFREKKRLFAREIKKRVAELFRQLERLELAGEDTASPRAEGLRGLDPDPKT